MNVRELRELLEGYDDTDEVIVAVDNKEGGVDVVLAVEQETDLGDGTFGLFATE